MHRKTIAEIKLFQQKTTPPPAPKKKKKDKKRYTNPNAHKDFPKIYEIKKSDKYCT